MAFTVQMPALGESVTEGTVTRWLKQEGDTVEVDEPLLEVSTDKVDTEIPSPVAGVLQRIVAAEDETVEVGGDLAVIADASDEPVDTPAPQAAAPATEAADDTAEDTEEQTEVEPAPADAPAPRSRPSWRDCVRTLTDAVEIQRRAHPASIGGRLIVTFLTADAIHQTVLREL